MVKKYLLKIEDWGKSEGRKLIIRAVVRISKICKKIVNLQPVGFWLGFSAGFIYFSYIFWWFWSVHHLASLGIESGVLAFLVILLPLVLTVTGMSLFWGIFGYFTVKFIKNRGVLFVPFFCAGAFVTLEYLRTWSFGILWLGKDSLLGPHWTLGNLSYLFVDLDIVRQSASYWGIYGIDFVLIFLSATLLLLVKFWHTGFRKNLIFQILAVIVALIAASMPQVNSTQENIQLVISAVQTKNPVNISYEADELLNDFSRKVELLKEASKNADVVIFPENADFSKTLSGFLDPLSAQKFFKNLSRKNILIVDSNRVGEGGKIKSRALLIDSWGGVVDFYDKRLLTPGGESLPYIAALPLSIFERLSGSNFVSSSVTYAGGTEDNTLVNKSSKTGILVLTCSDVISPSISRVNSLGFIINNNNLGVFNGNRLIAKQLLSMARYRAAENGKYLVVSSNYDLSYVVGPLGNVIKSTDSAGYKILTGEIVPNQTRTWYNKLGDWPILVVSLMLFVLGLKNSRNANQDKNFS